MTQIQGYFERCAFLRQECEPIFPLTKPLWEIKYDDLTTIDKPIIVFICANNPLMEFHRIEVVNAVNNGKTRQSRLENNIADATQVR